MPRYIDADALRARMYHEAFETDTDMQKWDSGCWIRYKLFENCIDKQPTLSPDEVRGVGKWIRLDVHKGMEQYKCSVCETPTYVPECMNDPMYGYCPNCGAKMEVSEDGD